MKVTDKFKKPFRAEVTVARLEDADGKVIAVDLRKGYQPKPKKETTK